MDIYFHGSLFNGICMNEEIHPPKPPNHEHGATGSYIVGFILSLIFTIIPYYLVVNKTIAGNMLVAVIIGIAVIQMFIQIFFFLHLGRGPKPFYNVVFFFATAGLIVVVIGASLLIMNNLYHNMSPQEITRRLAQEESISQIGGEETGACQVANESHIITIKNGQVSPIRIEAQMCDALTFINEDEKEREIVFGSHPDYDSYGGIFEVEVSNGRPETINLNQSGDFSFHDHQDPELIGYFTVLP
jgi:cytochrome o ubiquinol oxidase operon protein cyoD